MKNSIPIFVILVIVTCACRLQPGQQITPTLPLPSATPLQVESTDNPEQTLPVPPGATPDDIQTQQGVVRNLANAALHALKEQDMLTLSTYVHPVAGLRFSPYAFVRETDLVFSVDQLAGLFADPTIYHWGIFDGSGYDINLSFADYYAEFIYDVDFVNAPQASTNIRIGHGNSLDNALEFYPGAIIVEYHFPGFDSAYEGMDWRSLRLVFQEFQFGWCLVGIIHDEWTT